MSRKAWLGGVLVALLGLTSTPAHAQTHTRPEIRSFAVQDVRTTSAKFSASVVYHERQGEFWFSYCRVSECANGEIETPHQQDVPESEAEANSPRTAEWPVNGLLPATDYRVTAHVANDTFSNDPAAQTITFRTPGTSTALRNPAATTEQESGVTSRAATLNGTAVPGTTGNTAHSSSAYFQWGANGALNQTTPAQTLPADANPYPLSAALTGLTPNTDYSYRLVVSREGQQFLGAVRTLRTADEPHCTAPATYQTVTAERVVAVGCFQADGNTGRYVADGEVRVNGVLFSPAGSAHSANQYRFATSSPLQSYLNAANRLYIDRPGRAFGTTGEYAMSVSNLPHMHTGAINRTGVQWSGTAPLMSVGADRSVDLFSFPLAGQLSWTPSADGSSRLGLLVGLPRAWRIEEITGDAAVKVNPGGDLAFDRLRLDIGALPMGSFEIGDLHFLYDRTDQRWEGGASVTLPTASRMQVGASVIVQNGRLISFAGDVNGLNQHLAYGVFLQRVGVRVGVTPVHLGGTIGLSAGPRVGGVGILGITGSFDVEAGEGHETRQLPNGATTAIAYPGYIRLSGSATVFDIPLRTISATWYFSQRPWFEVETSLGIDIHSGNITVFKAMGTVRGMLYDRDFEISGDAELTVFDIDVASGHALLGTRGVGACGHVTGLGDIGAYKQWGGSFALIHWCDMKQLRSTIGGQAATAAAAGARPLTLPGDDLAVVRFQGRGGAPQVVLHGPGGRTITTPAAGKGGAMEPGKYVAIRDEEHDYTDVKLAKPGAGWTYETAPGSVPVTGVQTAGQLPALKVNANVVRLGNHAELRWQLGDLAGRRVTFMEAGPGAPPRVLKRTTAAKGSVRFTPYLALQRQRHIVALVEQDGRPLSREQVATYTAPAAPHATKVGALKAVRRGGKTTVSWRKQAGAVKYRVFVAQANGRRAMKVVKRSKLVLRGEQGRTAQRVTVQAIGLDAKAGKPAAVKVK